MHIYSIICLITIQEEAVPEEIEGEIAPSQEQKRNPRRSVESDGGDPAGAEENDGVGGGGERVAVEAEEGEDTERETDGDQHPPSHPKQHQPPI